MVLFDMVPKQRRLKALSFGAFVRGGNMPCLTRAKAACARCPMENISDGQINPDNVKFKKMFHEADLSFTNDRLGPAKIQSKSLGRLL
jgi:hypothetical protein